MDIQSKTCQFSVLFVLQFWTLLAYKYTPKPLNNIRFGQPERFAAEGTNKSPGSGRSTYFGEAQLFFDQILNFDQKTSKNGSNFAKIQLRKWLFWAPKQPKILSFYLRLRGSPGPPQLPKYGLEMASRASSDPF